MDVDIEHVVGSWSSVFGCDRTQLEKRLLTAKEREGIAKDAKNG
jgi:hypothetical protein